MKNKKYFITGIGTDVGKTVVSAIVAEALHATYWKPIQAGDLNNSDRHKVQSWTRNVQFLEEAHALKTPMSPHAAAEIDGVAIDQITLPHVDGNLVVEGAGGLLVPLNSKGKTIADLVIDFKLPVIVVSRHYLGSINHTLLTLQVLKQRNIPIRGIIFVGDEHPTTESIIASTGNVEILGRIPIAKELTPSFIQEQALKFTEL